MYFMNYLFSSPSLQHTAFTPSSKIILSLKIKNDSSVDVSGYTVNVSHIEYIPPWEFEYDPLNKHCVFSSVKVDL